MSITEKKHSDRLTHDQIERIESLFTRYMDFTSTENEERVLIRIVRNAPDSVPEQMVEALLPELVAIRY